MHRNCAEKKAGNAIVGQNGWEMCEGNAGCKIPPPRGDRPPRLAEGASVLDDLIGDAFGAVPDHHVESLHKAVAPLALALAFALERTNGGGRGRPLRHRHRNLRLTVRPET